MNPSDHFADMTTLDQRSLALKKESMTRIEEFKSAWYSMSSEFKIPRGRFESDATFKRDKWAAPWHYEWAVLLHRNLLDAMHDFSHAGANLVQAVGIMVIYILSHHHYQFCSLYAIVAHWNGL